MMKPTEDRIHRQLVYECRVCARRENGYNKEPVHQNYIQHTLKERTTILLDISEDPTLPRTEKQCPNNCGNNVAVYRQMQATDGNENMTFMFACTNCRHQWTE